ncbi:MAG: hypothetical protein O9282_14855 [Flavobacterium sp.]|uniref:hypothetical protein n=1 Tax=Flavobacterium sp. TaxID=239 RepID=UPI0022CA77D7|nr:hypothetical protein [Flavobacterium sp.]MCZ8023869.1 hypothetical protein [Cytophagales bacterium]MCZ8332587.1 hypothetical protein [Flavobacterium sp.]
MHLNVHKDFIQTSITGILRDVIAASKGIGSGIETFPLCDYIMQSVFMKMTGFQEQKMKCIIWELANIDFEYRRILLSNDDKLGECSSYSDKNKIYKRLVEQINKYDPKFDIKTIDKTSILTETVDYIKTEFENTNLSIWAQGSFNDFLSSIETVLKQEYFIEQFEKGKTNLFANVLREKYEVLYKHRNRIAHNTPSYQQNLPTLKSLTNPNYRYENYFIYFSILILIDNVFIELYKKYLTIIESNTN